MLLGAAGVGAATAFAFLTSRAGKRPPTRVDRVVRKHVRRRRHPVGDAIAFVLTLPGLPVLYMPASALIAHQLRRRGATGGSAVMASTIASFAAHHLVKVFVVRARPPSQRSKANALEAFPSGHTTPVTAVALTTAWVLGREGIGSAARILPIALGLPTIVGATRVYLDRHWTTDVLAGWALGTAVSAAADLLYELRRDRA